MGTKNLTDEIKVINPSKTSLRVVFNELFLKIKKLMLNEGTVQGLARA